MLHGSCLCGGIKYQINGQLSGPLNCHCSMCRKAQGSAFRSRAAVKSAEFEFVQGEELITFYKIIAGKSQGFLPGVRIPILSNTTIARTIMACRWARWMTIPASAKTSCLRGQQSALVHDHR